MNTDGDGNHSPDNSQSDEFAANTFQSLYEVFWEPEINRRGGLDAVGPIRKALAVLPPGKPPEISLNDEADLIVSVRATRPIAAGESIFLDDFDDIRDLRPARVPDDAAWVAVVVLADGRAVSAFDFRRNKGRGRRLLSLADDYLATAQEAAAAGRIGPAVETAHAAAELAVTAMMFLTIDDPVAGKRNRHGQRLHWFNWFTQLGNAPRELHTAFSTIAKQRTAARYGDRRLDVTVPEIEGLLAAVRDIIEHARAQIGERMASPLSEPTRERTTPIDPGDLPSRWT